MTSTELSLVENDLALGSVSRAREALDQIRDITELKDFSDRAAAAEAYFRRAKDTRHLAIIALEVRLWAERRAGWVFIDDFGEEPDDFGDRAKAIGTSGNTLRRWCRFGRADEKHFASTIREATEKGELTVTGVDRRLSTKNLQRVERGIYVNYLGQYVIRWRDHGVSRQMACQTRDLSQARAELLAATGLVKPQVPKEKKRRPLDDVIDVYGSLRRLLQVLDQASPQLSRAVRTEVDKAYAGLHEAEDALGRALRVVER